MVLKFRRAQAAGGLPESKTLQEAPQNPLNVFLVSAGNARDFGEIADIMEARIGDAVRAGHDVIYLEHASEYPMIGHVKKPMWKRAAGSLKQRMNFRKYAESVSLGRKLMPTTGAYSFAIAEDYFQKQMRDKFPEKFKVEHLQPNYGQSVKMSEAYAHLEAGIEAAKKGDKDQYLESMRGHSERMLEYMRLKYGNQQQQIKEGMRKNPNAVFITVMPNAHIPFYRQLKDLGYNVGDKPAFESPPTELFNADEYLIRRANGEKIPEKEEEMCFLRDYISKMVYGHMAGNEDPKYGPPTRKIELEARRMTDQLSDDDVRAFWTKKEYIKHYSTPKFTHDWVQERLDRKKNVN